GEPPRTMCGPDQGQVEYRADSSRAPRLAVALPGPQGPAISLRGRPNAERACSPRQHVAVAPTEGLRTTAGRRPRRRANRFPLASAGPIARRSRGWRVVLPRPLVVSGAGEFGAADEGERSSRLCPGRSGTPPGADV